MELGRFFNRQNIPDIGNNTNGRLISFMVVTDLAQLFIRKVPTGIAKPNVVFHVDHSMG